MQIEDKIYYLRVVMAAIAGSILGAIVKPNSDQSNTIGLTILVGIIFYSVSHIIASRMAGDLPKEKNNYNSNFWFYFHVTYVYGINIYGVKPTHHMKRLK